MIKRLYIEDFLLIKDVGLEFCKGLNVISGETGTGKSMSISALSFVAGKQGNYPDNTAVEVELEAEEELVLRREIKGGRSRYFLNGRGTTRSTVQEILSDRLILQGQNDTLKLLREEFQRNILDTYGGLEERLHVVGELYDKYMEKKRELKRKSEELEALRSQRDYLEFQIKEVEELSLTAQEIEELKRRAEVYKHREKLARATSKATTLLYDMDNSASALISEALRELLKVRELDSSLDLQINKLSSIKELLEELSYYMNGDSYNISQAEIDDINEKLYRVQRLEDKYKKDYAQILEYVNDLRGKLHNLEKYEEELENIKAELSSLEARLYESCKRLSEERKSSAKKLEEDIKDILKELNLERASLKVEFEETKPNRFGIDRIRFLFSSYGSQHKPLEEVASGGELSRLFLALSLLQPVQGTYLFDEIDIGISGEASLKLAKLLKRVAQNMQVIVITHSSSICAAGDKNFLTQKEFIGNIPLVRVKELSSEEKVREVARLMGAETETTIEGARELISFIES